MTALEAFIKYYEYNWEEEYNPRDITQVVKRQVFIAGWEAAHGNVDWEDEG